MKRDFYLNVYTINYKIMKLTRRNTCMKLVIVRCVLQLIVRQICISFISVDVYLTVYRTLHDHAKHNQFDKFILM